MCVAIWSMEYKIYVQKHIAHWAVRYSFPLVSRQADRGAHICETHLFSDKDKMVSQPTCLYNLKDSLHGET